MSKRRLYFERKIVHPEVVPFFFDRRFVVVPLPGDKLEAFEGWLARRWFDASFYQARGAVACSFGLLGLRWCEVERSRVGDLMPEAPALFVRTGKRGRARTIEANAELLRAAIAMRRRVDGGDDRVFVTREGRGLLYRDIRRFVGRATKEVFGRPFSFHCFRHTAAVRVWQRTRDVLVVQTYLGHKSLVWTQAYLCTLCPPLTGGPVAFSGGGTGAKPRLYDPEGLGELREVRAVACAKPRGKAAAGGDQEAFEFDERIEARRKVKQHDCRDHLTMKFKWLAAERGVASKCEVCGSMWEFSDEHPTGRMIAEGETPTDRVAEAAKERREKIRQAQSRCTHSELRERTDGRGRRSLWCKVCGAFYGYTFEAGEKR